MASTINVGIIGCGLMGGVHAESYNLEKGCKLAGFQNRTRDKAEALAKQFGGKVYDTVDELLADPGIDAVSITSSQQVHSEQVIAAAKAGKHILVEKPLALTIKEMEAAQKAVEQAGVTAMVAHQLRFHPVIEAVRKNLPKLGSVFHLEIEMTFRIGAPTGRCWEDYRSGGFFMELGCHLADLSRFMMGEVRNVSANTLRLNPERVTEDFTQCLLQFESGAIGSIIVSANHRTTRQGLLQGRVLGANGRIDFTIYPYSRALNQATLTLDKGEAIFVPDVTVKKLDCKLPASLSKVYPGFFDVYQREVHEFLQAVRGKQESPITVADGRAAVEIILAAYADQGATTDKPNFGPGKWKYRADEACHPLLQTGK